jgi:hypothetical protein
MAAKEKLEIWKTKQFNGDTASIKVQVRIRINLLAFIAEN